MASQSNPLCLGEQNGTIKLSVEGGNGGFTFIRDNTFKQDSLRFTDLTQGDYTFKVTDRRACEDTVTSVRLKWPKGLTASVTPFSPTCFGDINGKIEVIASGGIGGFRAFLDKTKDAIFDSKTSKAVFQNLTAGNYTLAISDANGCQVISPATILEADKLNSQIILGGELRTSDSVVVCKGQFVTLNAQNPGKEIRWFRNNVPLPTYNDKNTIDNDTVGVYKVIVKNATGCEVSDSFALKNNNKALRADFLIPTQAFVGDTVVCLDITKPIPDRVVWGLPDVANILEKNSSKVSSVFIQEGEFEVKMKVHRESCENEVTHKIKLVKNSAKVLESENQGIRSVSIFPNPSSGVFKIKIVLSDINPIDIKINNNISGRSVYSFSDNGKSEYAVDLNLNVLSGLYILTIASKNEVSTHRIFINR